MLCLRRRTTVAIGLTEMAIARRSANQRGIRCRRVLRHGKPDTGAAWCLSIIVRTYEGHGCEAEEDDFTFGTGNWAGQFRDPDRRANRWIIISGPPANHQRDRDCEFI